MTSTSRRAARAALLLPLAFGGCGRALLSEPPRLPSPLAPESTRPTPLVVFPEAAVDPAVAAARPGQGFRRVGAGLLPTGAQPVRVDAGGGAYTLNFVDAEVGEIARVVLGDILQVAYVLDPSVRGRVTLQTPRPVPRASLLGVLEAALNVQGDALVRSGDVYRIVPRNKARGRLAPADGAGTGVTVVPLRFANAEDVRRALQPLAADEVGLIADPARNLIVLTGDGEQVANFTSLIDALDSDVMAGRSFGLFPLDSADARAVAAELREAFRGVDVRFVEVERVNAVLAIAPEAATLDRAASLVAGLDQAGGRNERGVYVYDVRYRDADDLARLLARLYGAPVEDETRAEEGDVAPGIETSRVSGLGGSSGGGVVAAPLAGGEGGGSLGGISGGGADDTGITPGTRPVAAFQTGAAPTGQGAAPDAAAQGGDGATDGAGPTGIRILPDDGNNTIVVQATSEEWRTIQAALNRLDRVPLQVLIEATIAEVTLTDSLRYGVQFSLRAGDFTLRNLATRAALPVAAAPGFGATFVSSANTRVVLDALSEITDVNVISSPQVMVVNNETAFLQVGNQVPISVQSAQPIDLTNPILINSIELRNTGVILQVTPRISPSGSIGIAIDQEVSDVVPGTNLDVTGTPSFSTRRVSSTVSVDTGRTVVLGGLIRDTGNNGRSGIPFLSDLPLIGPLFGTRTNSGERTELIVLLTPYIIRDGEDARAIGEEVRRRLDYLPREPAARRAAVDGGTAPPS